MREQWIIPLMDVTCLSSQHRRQQTPTHIRSRALSVEDCTTIYVQQGSVIVNLAGDKNVKVSQLSSNEAHLKGPFGFESCRSEKWEWLLAWCSDYRSLLVSTTRYPTWRAPSSSWTQIDHIAIIYGWCGCLQDSRSYWSTPFGSNHTFVCTK